MSRYPAGMTRNPCPILLAFAQTKKTEDGTASIIYFSVSIERSHLTRREISDSVRQAHLMLLRSARRLLSRKAYVFPGQGTVRALMGTDLAREFKAAALVFERVDEALKQKLSKIMLTGVSPVTNGKVQCS
jgi:hypothetical protein